MFGILRAIRLPCNTHAHHCHNCTHKSQCFFGLQYVAAFSVGSDSLADNSAIQSPHRNVDQSVLWTQVSALWLQRCLDLSLAVNAELQLNVGGTRREHSWYAGCVRTHLFAHKPKNGQNIGHCADVEDADLHFSCAVGHVLLACVA